MELSPRWACCIAAAALWTEPAAAQVAALVDLSLEELGNVTITSTAKREQRLADAPASLFVITADDIRRSGATRLPEALRLAPNLHIAQVYNSGYAISARGFNGSAANKLLVLIDGRSVYTPLFAGVFWDVQDVLLEDVDRIEVSSGPGSTLWGVNAVNGVINIITRRPAATRGTLAAVSAGDQERASVLRHGWSLGNDGDMRLYVKHTTQDRTETAAGTPVEDAGHMLRGGLRADWGRGGERFTLQGNGYRGNHGQPLPGSINITGVKFALDTITLSGANLLARWEKPLAGGDLSVQGYLDRTVRVTPPTFDETLSIADLEVQYTLRPTQAHTVVLGANHRRSRDYVGHGAPQFAFLPARRDQAWTSLYAQDEMTLADSLRLTLGARVERNDYTGNEFLPSLRLAWKPAPDQLWWAAATHTVRAPSRLDRDIYIPAQPPFILNGGPDFRSETANVLELGYRGQLSPAVTLSATAFHGDYDHLHTQELAPSGTSVYFGNGMKGRVSGLEAWGSLQATPWLRLHGGLTLLRPRLELKPGSIDTAGSVAAAEGAMPRRTWRLRAALNLPREGELDLVLRHVGALSAPSVPAYTAVDLRLGGRLSADVDIALTARNLSGSHGEFTDLQTRTEFGRTIQLQVRMRWQ
ncbi:iron complex outermembrane receptor protein [Pelomonas saccharophila]|uniref:Iron complex outermembrane receptor protein n=1 Tax=Roseateles saccharophilus TaxID=304 RepID=A0ABU1YKN9_ROSSA|nr:TonB-dependent receptor [Roseateles saccharophilus]MDR7269431.1 iron complex outermembrane receptor protein [Roseateles saccharophilus]